MNGAIDFPAKERELYSEYFAKAALGSDCVLAQQAADLLYESGLQWAVLRDIWNFVDYEQRGFVQFEDFCVLLRLTAHAQSGATLAPELVYVEPAHPLQLQASFQDGFPQPPTQTESLSVPTARQLRKYGRLFCRTASSGVLVASEAWKLFNFSGLPDRQLSVIWDLSDADGDGSLVWPEFVAAMHLIRCARNGDSSVIEFLPAGLRPFLASLEGAEFYAAQPSRSPRSLSPAGSQVFAALDTVEGSPTSVTTQWDEQPPDAAQPAWPADGPCSSFKPEDFTSRGPQKNTVETTDSPAWSAADSQMTFAEKPQPSHVQQWGDLSAAEQPSPTDWNAPASGSSWPEFGATGAGETGGTSSWNEPFGTSSGGWTKDQGEVSSFQESISLPVPGGAGSLNLTEDGGLSPEVEKSDWKADPAWSLTEDPFATRKTGANGQPFAVVTAISAATNPPSQEDPFRTNTSQSLSPPQI